MPERRLPDQPDIDQLKHQAKDLLRDIKQREPAAVAAFDKYHPEGSNVRAPKLADAHLVLARTYGAPSWPRLVLACRIIEAISTDDPDAVRQLGLKGPDVLNAIASSSRGQTMLESRPRIMQMLRVTSARLRPPRGAVMGAAEALNARGLSYLLQMGAEICDKSGDWRPVVALVLETYSRNPSAKHECLELLVRYGIELPDTPPMAAHRGRMDLLERHLAHDPALLMRTFSHEEIYPPALGCHSDEWLAFHGTPLAGATLMHMAIDYDELEIARWLLDRGMDANVRAAVDREGFGAHTPLFSAVVSYAWYVRSKYALPKPNDDPYAKLLLEHDANPNVRASLRSRMHADKMHVYRDVTPLAWGEQFHAKELVSTPAMLMISARGGTS